MKFRCAKKDNFSKQGKVIDFKFGDKIDSEIQLINDHQGKINLMTSKSPKEIFHDKLKENSMIQLLQSNKSQDQNDQIALEALKNYLKEMNFIQKNYIENDITLQEKRQANQKENLDKLYQITSNQPLKHKRSITSNFNKANDIQPNSMGYQINQIRLFENKRRQNKKIDSRNQIQGTQNQQNYQIKTIEDQSDHQKIEFTERFKTIQNDEIQNNKLSNNYNINQISPNFRDQSATIGNQDRKKYRNVFLLEEQKLQKFQPKNASMSQSPRLNSENMKKIIQQTNLNLQLNQNNSIHVSQNPSNVKLPQIILNNNNQQFNQNKNQVPNIQNHKNSSYLNDFFYDDALSIQNANNQNNMSSSFLNESFNKSQFNSKIMEKSHMNSRIFENKKSFINKKLKIDKYHHESQILQNINDIQDQSQTINVDFAEMKKNIKETIKGQYDLIQLQIYKSEKEAQDIQYELERRQYMKLKQESQINELEKISPRDQEFKIKKRKKLNLEKIKKTQELLKEVKLQLEDNRQESLIKKGLADKQQIKEFTIKF